MELRNLKQKVNETENNTNFEIDIKELFKSLADEKKKVQSKQKPENIHKDHRQRLKSQFINFGIDALTDVQKLELLLFYSIPLKDTNPTAHALLKEFGNLKNVMSADYSRLLSVKGVKENTATLIKYVNSMLNYCHKPETETILGSTAITKEYVSKFFMNVPVEQFYVICVSKSNIVKKAILINEGDAEEVRAPIRLITQAAIENKCNRIIIAHNHPDGEAVMSDEDGKYTYSVLCSCVLNNIEVLDHIICGRNKNISLAEQGIMSRLRRKAMDTIQISKDKQLFLSEQSKDYIICEPDD